MLTERIKELGAEDLYNSMLAQVRYIKKIINHTLYGMGSIKRTFTCFRFGAAFF